MSNLELLRSKQPIVYNILNNSLNNNSLSHAYMFSGIKGSLQDETVDLFVSSLICQEDVWACGVCDNCQRMMNQTYPDYIILDGSQGMIKKNDVLNLQTQFSMTALEKSSYKIFVIKEAHNMTASAANSLLKFLEEPSDHVIGILVSDKLDAILPTVISRCTVLDFKQLPFKDNYDLAIQKGLSPRDAYYYSKVARVYCDLESLEELESYKLFKLNFEKFINNLYASEDNALYILQSSLMKHTNKEEMNIAINMFLDMLIVFFKDVLNNNEVDEWYDNLIKVYRDKTNTLEYLEVTLEIKNKVMSHINMPLLLDQFIYKVREGKHE